MIKLSKAFVWRTALVSMAVVSVSFATLIWRTGDDETRNAYFTARRLIINRDTGMIQGKIINTASLKKPGEAPVTPDIQPLASFGFLYAEAPQEKPAEVQAPVEVKVSAIKPDESFLANTPPENNPAPQKQDEVLDSFAFLYGRESMGQGEVVEEKKPVEEPKKPELSEHEKTQMEKEDELKIAEAIKSAPILSNAPTISPSMGALPDVNLKLAEQAEVGTLPIIGPDGTKPWKYYSKQSDYKKGPPAIAIMVTGLGQNRLVAENAVKLPENISLSFTPYARDTMGWGKAARLTGHELLIDLPLEPSNYPITDPGPKGLLIEKGAQENEKRLEWIMSRYPASIGFITPQNEKFSGDSEGFKILLQSLANRGLLIVMSAEPHKSETKALIDSSATPLVVADMLVDEELSANSIQTRLTALEHMAKKRGYAIGIVQPYPITIEQIKLWSETLKEKGIVLVPVSAIAKLRFS